MSTPLTKKKNSLFDTQTPDSLKQPQKVEPHLSFRDWVLISLAIILGVALIGAVVFAFLV